MTSPESSGAPRPLRVAGLALLALAVVALAGGLITVLNGGDEDNTAKPPAPTSTSTREPPPTTTTTTKAPGSATSTITPPPASSSKAPPPGGDGNGEPGRTQPVRVYNNSLIEHLAARAAADLRSDGWHVVQIGPYRGTIPTTTVYYRPGTPEKAAATELGHDFGMRVMPRFTGIEDFPPGVLVIVTKDYEGVSGKNEGS